MATWHAGRRWGDQRKASVIAVLYKQRINEGEKAARLLYDRRAGSWCSFRVTVSYTLIPL